MFIEQQEICAGVQCRGDLAQRVQRWLRLAGLVLLEAVDVDAHRFGHGLLRQATLLAQGDAPAGLPGQCVRRRRMVLSRRCAESTIRGEASQVHTARSCVACRRASPSVRRNPRKPNPSGEVGPVAISSY